MIQPSPLFNCIQQRAAGLLLHPSSLPSSTGIGNFGRNARKFIDFLHRCGISYWQICPLGPTGYGDSPYQSFSAFAGNPYFIDLETLTEQYLIHKKDLHALHKLPHDRVDYAHLYQHFWPVLKQSFQNFSETNQPELYQEFKTFKTENFSWLFPYALFKAIKTHHQEKPWWEWPQQYQSFESACESKLSHDLENKIEAQTFFQFLFHHQWDQLRRYSHQKGIKIIGDIPIFIASDSADLWHHKEIFITGKNGRPSLIAGVPPDCFSETGQLWGNPLYDWNFLKEHGYQWWIDRLKNNFKLFDAIRIDHFRAFDTYWALSADSENAINGEWNNGPGLHFFEKMKEAFPKGEFIAEDLGNITPNVVQLRKDTNLPGMAILQFAFGGSSKHPFLPHNLIKNQVVYAGTHDNDTTIGWYNTAEEHEKDFCKKYLRTDGKKISWDFIRALYSSTPNLTVLSMQDLLNLDGNCRMNVPSQPDGNWQWRYTQEQLKILEIESSGYLKELGCLYDR